MKPSRKQVRVDSAIHAIVKKKSAEHNLTISDVVTMAVCEFLGVSIPDEDKEIESDQNRR